MAPVTFHLFKVNNDSNFLAAVQDLSPSERPIYLGKTHHWVHAPNLSTKALTGDGQEILKWDYLFIGPASNYESFAVRAGLKSHITRVWSLTTDCVDEALNTYSETHATRNSAPVPPLPSDWSPADPSGLAAAVPPSDLEASLGLSAHALGTSTSEPPVPLKDFVKKFGSEHTGPISMFGLLAYNPGKRPVYFQYVAAFQELVGSKYGGNLQVPGLGVTEWSSRGDEKALTAKEAEAAGKVAGWEDAALVWYPSIWHFAKMLDDEEYAKIDRAYKHGVLQDNPLFCCTEVKIDYK